MTEKLFFKRSFYFIVTGMFFLINPLINILDALPDGFGYLLLFFGLTELGLIDGKMESARRKLTYLMMISALKHILMFPVMSSSISSDKLLATFSFALMELPLLIFFCIDFFDGFSYLAECNDGDSVTQLISNAKFMSMLFFSVKIVLSIVPELFSFAETRMTIDISDYEFYRRLLSTKPYAVAFTMLVVMILGIFWYVGIVKLMNSIKKDLPFVQKMQDVYSSVFLAFPEKQSFRTIKNGLFTALFGCIFFFDTAVDGVRILPNAFAVLIIWISATILKKNSPFDKTQKVAPFAFAAQIFTEFYRYFYVDTQAVFLSQLDTMNVTINALVVVINACLTILFLSVFLIELRNMYEVTTTLEAPSFDFTRIVFLAAMVVHSLQIILPSIHEETSALYMILTAVWIALCGKCFTNMIDDYKKTVRLL
ncbi:MAG TPA: hypothetical protein DD733_08550 [Clostridiales bacterium]|nr:hypothetical protein [Eubacteriales bacterium]HBR32117.1 hypothetical protein [Clostridiales bacterium]